MNQLEAIYREALENIKNTLDGCGMRQDEEMPLSELLLLRVAREALSAQGEQGTDQKLLDDAVDCIRAFMYRFHPAGQSLEPEGPKINLEKTFEIAINILSRYINLNAPTAQEPPTETQERCPKLVKIKDGWENAGEILKQLGEPVLVGGQLWTPVLMPDEEDPEFFKSSGLVPVTESKEGRGE